MNPFTNMNCKVLIIKRLSFKLTCRRRKPPQPFQKIRSRNRKDKKDSRRRWQSFCKNASKQSDKKRAEVPRQ